MEALADLARSGLTARDSRLMRVRQLSPKAVEKLTGHATAAYQLPYFNTRGQAIDYYRLRFSEPVTDLRAGRELRYWQPPRTPPHAYLPPHVDWRAVLKDKDQSLVVTEGEKKAACGAKLLGRPVVGLGGVWSFMSRAQRMGLLPELVPLAEKRQVLLCYDQDPSPNPDVVAARQALAYALGRAGADTWLVQLPAGRGKVGLDDFLVEHGAAAFDDLDLVRAGEFAEFEKINAEVAVIVEAHALYHHATGALFQEPRRLAQVLYADRKVTVYSARGDAAQKNALAEWTQWPRRTTYQRLAYAPGKPRLNGGTLNVWPGWGAEPKRGDVRLFRRLIDRLFEGPQRAHSKWFLQWLSFPLQHPGAKLYTSVLFFSLAEGVGKSLVGETMGRIYGRNFAAIQAEHLHAPFNDWAKHKQFILGDEVTGRDRQEDIDHLKGIITRETIQVNQKYQALYTVPDLANYLLTTNRPAALMMAGRDRRFFVHEVTAEPLPDSFYREYDAWYRSAAGAGALFEWLLRVDLAGFNPHGLAPATLAKEEMTELASSPVEFDAAALLADPARWLLDSPRDLYTAHEVAALLSAQGQRSSAVAVGRALKALGCPRFFVKTARGTVKVYAVRRRDEWARAGHAELARHYNGSAGEGGR